MKKTILLVMLVAIIVLTSACARQEDAASGTAGQATGTFAPPEPQPGELGTDAMTQTVELTDGRSENEGGALTSTDPSVTGETATTTTSTSSPPPPRKP